MANSFHTNPIVLDTFTGAIDLRSALGLNSSKGSRIKISSIEWQIPTTIGHTCVITDAASGVDVFRKTCTVANQSVVKYFYGAPIQNISRHSDWLLCMFL